MITMTMKLNVSMASMKKTANNDFSDEASVKIGQ